MKSACVNAPARINVSATSSGMAKETPNNGGVGDGLRTKA
jgi:hypothetical protein